VDRECGDFGTSKGDFFGVPEMPLWGRFRLFIIIRRQINNEGM